MQKQILDQKRKQLVDLETKKDHLSSLSENLANDLIKEQQIASESVEMNQYLPNYIAQVQERQEHFKEHMEKLDEKIFALRDEIQLIFGDVKKFEIVLENRKTNENKAIAKTEQEMLDEAGIVSFLRKEAEEE